MTPNKFSDVKKSTYHESICCTTLSGNEATDRYLKKKQKSEKLDIIANLPIAIFIGKKKKEMRAPYLHKNLKV